MKLVRRAAVHTPEFMERNSFDLLPGRGDVVDRVAEERWRG